MDKFYVKFFFKVVSNIFLLWSIFFIVLRFFIGFSDWIGSDCGVELKEMLDGLRLDLGFFFFLFSFEIVFCLLSECYEWINSFVNWLFLVFVLSFKVKFCLSRCIVVYLFIIFLNYLFYSFFLL